MKRIFLITFVIVGTCIIAQAQSNQISTNEAVLAALARVSAETSLKNIEVRDIAYCSNRSNDTLLFEIETSAGLTVLVSGNRACQPFLGIHSSDEGMLLNQLDSLPCGLQCIINDYKRQISDCFLDTSQTATHIQDWQTLISGEMLFSPKNGSVQPLTTSMWSQREPNLGDTNADAYNYLIQGDTGCSHWLAGCAAVAMGQVMYYWKHPVIIGTRENQFDWCNMTDYLNTNDELYIENRNAISYLLSECGQSVNMQYGCDASGANIYDVHDALIRFFNYYDNARVVIRIGFKDLDWIKLIKNNLNISWPVIYRASSIEGGHEFICDGYNSSDEFHFNWGWGGDYSGPFDYYTINSLTPGTFNFQDGHAAIVNLQPNGRQYWCHTTLYLEQLYAMHATHNHPIYTATPQTMTKLISASIISPSTWRTIPINATVEYRAHEEIHLRDGFTVERGAEFTAQIVPCANCENNRGVEDQSIVETGNEQEESVPDMAAGRPSIATEGLREETVLYPNPTDGELTMNVDGEVQSIVIYNALGRPIGGWKLHAITPDHVTLDINPLATGTYLLLVTTATGSRTAKFIKQ